MATTVLDEREILRNVRQTLSMDEAKLIRLLRSVAYGKIEVAVENNKIVNKKRIENIKE